MQIVKSTKANALKPWYHIATERTRFMAGPGKNLLLGLILFAGFSVIVLLVKMIRRREEVLESAKEIHIFDRSGA